jgi:hypothetical protein
MLLGWKSSTRRLAAELTVRGLAICWSCSDCARRFYLTPAEIEHSMLQAGTPARISAEFAEHNCRMISLIPWTSNPTIAASRAPGDAFASMTVSPHRGIHLVAGHRRRDLVHD